MKYLAVLLLLFCSLPAPAQAPPGTVLLENWQNRRTDTGRIGWVHLRCVLEEREGKKVIRSTLKDGMKYLRSEDPYEETQEQYTLETESGEVIEVGYKTPLGKKLKLIVRGTPKGEKILLEVLDQEEKKTIYKQEKAWNKKAIGLYNSEKFFVGKELKPGEVSEMPAFQASMNAVVVSKYKMLAEEEVTIQDKSYQAIKFELFHDKELYLDKSQVWIDKTTRTVLKTQEDSVLFGTIYHENAPQELAMAPVPGKVKDRDNPITINKPLPIGLLGLPGWIRVSLKLSEEDKPEEAFATDRRQVLLKKENGTAEFLLGSKPLKEAGEIKEEKPGEEYTRSNFYIRSDDELVQQKAKEAIGNATTTRAKMRRITKWVGDKVKGNYEVTFATADEVARTMEGDCTEMGVLAAAMGRAVGIPTRACFGLVYNPDPAGFGGHLWTEAYIDGKWETFDPTGVIPELGAGYIKIDGFSFDSIISPDEIVKIRRAFHGKMHVTVLETK